MRKNPLINLNCVNVSMNRDLIRHIFTAYDYQKMDTVKRLIGELGSEYRNCFAYLYKFIPEEEHRTKDDLFCKVTSVMRHISHLSMTEANSMYSQIDRTTILEKNVAVWVKALYGYATYFLNIVFDIETFSSELFNTKTALQKYSKSYYAKFLRLLGFHQSIGGSFFEKYKIAGEILKYLGRYTEYIETVLMYYQNNPKGNKSKREEDESLLNYAIYLATKHDLIESLAQLYQVKGISTFTRENPKASLKWFIKSYEHSSENRRIKYYSYIWMAKCYLYLGDEDATFEILSEMENEMIRFPVARDVRLKFEYHSIRGLYYRMEGNLIESIHEYQEAHRIVQGLGFVNFKTLLSNELSYNYILIGNYNKAIERLANSQENYPDTYNPNLGNYFLLLLAMISNGSFKEAKELLELVTKSIRKSDYDKMKIDLIRGILARHDLQIDYAQDLLEPHQFKIDNKEQNYVNLENAYALSEISFLTLVSRDMESAIDYLDHAYHMFINYKRLHLFYKVLYSFFEINYHSPGSIDDIDSLYIDLDRYNVSYNNDFIDFYYYFAKGLYHITYDLPDNQSADYYFHNALSIKAPVEDKLKCIYYLLETDQVQKTLKTTTDMVNDVDLNKEIVQLIERYLNSTESMFLHLMALVIQLKIEIIKTQPKQVKKLYYQIMQIQSETNYYGFNTSVEEWLKRCDVARKAIMAEQKNT